MNRDTYSAQPSARPARDHETFDAESLRNLLHEKMQGLSKADRKLATYVIGNIESLHFETGASMARAVGVSEMTVSRFIRTIGFESLKQLKLSLRMETKEPASDIDDYMARFQPDGPKQKERQESMRLEMEAVAKAYALANSPAWDEAMTALATARHIHVLGFHVSRGLAMDLAARFQWIRPDVHFVINETAGLGEVLTADPETDAVIMIDTAIHAKRGLKLAERLKARELPLVVLTDRFSLWGWSHSRWVFEARGFVKTFWDSNAALAVLANLLLNDVAEKLGSRARTHHHAMTEAVQSLGEQVGRQNFARGRSTGG